MTSHRLALCVLGTLIVATALDAAAQAPTGMSTGPEARMAAPVPTPPPADGPPSSVDVLVSGQGEPIPGVKVTLAPDTGRPAEQWNSGDSQPVGVVVTDATGHARFPKVPAGRYIATTSCGIPGNWIAGNYASRVDAFAGRPISVMLTMRRGGMIRGKALRAGKAVGRCDLRADSPDALMSTCGMMSPTLVDTATGEFTITKIPLNADTWVKCAVDVGLGTLSVWHAYNMAKPETLDITVPFPTLDANNVGTLVLRFRPDTTAPVDSGNASLLLVQPDGSWRYETAARINAGRDSVATLKNIPAGGYQIRANAYPGPNKWWNAPIDSVHVVAGKSSEYVIHARAAR